MREIKPTDLGIPESAFADVEADESDDATRAAPLSAATFEEGADLGNMVAFFAAQSTETTPEKGYEVTLEDGTVVKQNYGVFTHTIFSAMAKNPAMTYRQLAQSVLASYAAGNMLKPTPLFEGSLDMPIFGNEDAADVAQWPTVVGSDKSLSISAGQLHGLAKGTKLLVLPSPASTTKKPSACWKWQATTSCAPSSSPRAMRRMPGSNSPMCRRGPMCGSPRRPTRSSWSWRSPIQRR
jgi:hypothetical protein